MQDILSIRKQAHIYASGLTAIIVMGTLSLFAACLAGIWLLFELAMLLLASIVECCSLIGTLYNGADSFVKLLLLASIGYVLYRVVRRFWRA